MSRPILVLLALALAVPAYAQAPAEPPAPAEAPPAPTEVPAAPAEVPAEPVEPPAAPAAAARSPVLDYIPDDAALAVVVRLGQLAKTNLWKTLAEPESGIIGKMRDSLPVALDLEKDVATAAYVLDTEYRDGEWQGLAVALVLETTRDVRAEDLLKQPAEPVTAAGLAVPAYPFAPDGLLAVPTPRIVVLATRESGQMRNYLARVLQSPAEAGRKPAGPDALPVAALAAPGEMTIAARMPTGTRDAILAAYDRYRRETLRPALGVERLMEFALLYNLVRIALQADRATGSLDLTRDADALRLEIRFASPKMAPFMADLLMALADPLQMALPALVGGQPLEEPAAEPLYRAVADGAAARVTMSRAGVYRTVEALAGTVRQKAKVDAGRLVSARNLVRIGAAAAAYRAAEGTFPRTWSDLKKTGLLADDALLLNPALSVHMPAGDYELVPLVKPVPEADWVTTVLAYEVYPPREEPDRLNVLFADGHVEYLDRVEFAQLYRLTLGRLGRN